jgi:hypothetical protein
LHNQGVPIRPVALNSTEIMGATENETSRSSLYALKTGTVDMLETMNFIVAERMSYVDDYLQ